MVEVPEPGYLSNSNGVLPVSSSCPPSSASTAYIHFLIFDLSFALNWKKLYNFLPLFCHYSKRTTVHHFESSLKMLPSSSAHAYSMVTLRGYMPKF